MIPVLWVSSGDLPQDGGDLRLDEPVNGGVMLGAPRLVMVPGLILVGFVLCVWLSRLVKGNQ